MQQADRPRPPSHRIDLRRCMVAVLALLLAAGLVGCGGDDDGDGATLDGATIDGATLDGATLDAEGGDPDGAIPDAPPGATPCPPTEGLECDTATQICVVRRPVGPSEVSSCEPVPNGCEDDRTCACAGTDVCTGTFQNCSEGEERNVIICECQDCQ